MDDRRPALTALRALGAAVIIAVAIMAIGGCTFEPPRAVLSLTALETLDGDRFEPEPVRRAGLVPSPLLWLAEGDQVFVRWDQYRIVFPDEFAKWPECLLSGGPVPPIAGLPTPPPPEGAPGSPGPPERPGGLGGPFRGPPFNQSRYRDQNQGSAARSRSL